MVGTGNDYCDGCFSLASNKQKEAKSNGNDLIKLESNCNE